MWVAFLTYTFLVLYLKSMEKKEFSYKFYSTTRTAWDGMLEAIYTAQKSIFWELFIFVDDKEGNLFVDALCARARVGVEVRLILDSWGSYEFSTGAIARLRADGVEVLWYNSLAPGFNIFNWFSRMWRRNHRKVLIVDEKIAFLGGVNVSAEHGSWDDVFLRLTGRVVNPLLRSFAKVYIYCGGDRARVRRFLHPKMTVGWKDFKDKFKYILHHRDYPRSAVKNMYLKGLAIAKDSYSLVTPYFIPDKEFLEMVAKARARGVKVNLYLPLRTDHKLMQWLTRSYLGITHRAGVNIFLLTKMNHAKAMLVDEQSGYVGSANLTPRSFYINEESGLLFDDKEMAHELNGFFEKWKKNSEPLDYERWKKRDWWHRLKEWFARKFEKYV